MSFLAKKEGGIMDVIMKDVMQPVMETTTPPTATISTSIRAIALIFLAVDNSLIAYKLNFCLLCV